MSPWRWVLLLLLLAGAPGGCGGSTEERAGAPPPVTLRVPDERQDLRGGFAYAVDPTGQTSWADVAAGTAPLALAWRVPAGPSVSFGFTDQVVWVHAVLLNPLPTPLTRILSMPGTVDSLDLFVRSDGVVTTLHNGKKTSYGARPLPSAELAFPLELAPHARVELWMRAEGRDSLALHPVVWTREAFQADNTRRSLVAAAYFGALGTMALFNLFIWISLRDRVYLYYSLFQFAAMLMMGAAEGRTFHYLWPSSPAWASRSEMIFTCLTLIAGLTFARNFLGSQYLAGWPTRIIRVLLAYFALVMVIAVFTDHRLIQLATLLAIALSCLAALAAAILATALGSPNGKIFATAWLILLTSGIFSVLAYASTWEAPIFEIEVPRLGSVAEAVLLSFALARRIKLAQRDKELVQAQLVAQERAHAHSLERRVAERTQELQETLQQLRQAQDRMVIQAKLAALGHLIAGMAHEVGNPLNFVMGGARELKRRLGALKASLAEGRLDPAAHGRALEGALEAAVLVQNGSDRIHRLIENLRAYTGVRSETMQSLEVAALLDSTLELISPLTSQQGIEVVRDFAPAPPVRGASGELGQVFLNLMLNGCQAMPRGGTLTLVVRPAAGHVEVLVKDSGQGVPTAHREAIFDPFFTTRLAEGTGLGLSISARIVGDHQGELRLLDEGPGASFLVSLPTDASGAGAEGARGANGAKGAEAGGH